MFGVLGFETRRFEATKKNEKSRRNTNLKMKFPSLIAILGVSATAKMVEVPMRQEIAKGVYMPVSVLLFSLCETPLSVSLKVKRIF